MALTLCAGCERHVRATDDACPYCGSVRVAKVPVTTTTSRRAMFVGAALSALAVDSVACGPVYGSPAVFEDIADGRRVDAGPPPPLDLDDEPSGACHDPSREVRLEATAPSLGRGVCTAAEITKVREACLGKLPSAACTSTIAANEACARCAMGTLPGDTEPAPVGARLPLAGVAYVPATEACAAFVVSRPECALELAKEELCVASTCATCGSSVARTQCAFEARQSTCAGLASGNCRDAVDLSRAAWVSLCVGSTPEGSFDKIAGLFCTAPDPVGDGGVDARPDDGSDGDAGPR